MVSCPQLEELVENLAIVAKHGLEVCSILLVEAVIYVLLLALQRREFLPEKLVRVADKILFGGAISQVLILFRSVQDFWR